MRSVEYPKTLEVGAIAEAMGLDVYTVREPGQMQDAVAAALDARRPSLIDIHVDAEIPPPLQDRAEVIGGFGSE